MVEVRGVRGLPPARPPTLAPHARPPHAAREPSPAPSAGAPLRAPTTPTRRPPSSESPTLPAPRPAGTARLGPQARRADDSQGASEGSGGGREDPRRDWGRGPET